LEDITMKLYTSIASRIGSAEAQALATRVAAWHDAMVAHERRQGSRPAGCDDECPHEEARHLWAEAVAVFGDSAQECEFLRTRGERFGSPSRPLAAGAIASRHLSG
jgi:hypothetical protein